jgi:hypothetical protein
LTWTKPPGNWRRQRHDAEVAYDSISLGNLDWAHTNAVTARAEADAAENVLRAALWAGADITEDR